MTSFKALVTRLNGLEKRGHNQLLLAHWYTQTYKFDQYADLKDLCLRIIEQLAGVFHRVQGGDQRARGVRHQVGLQRLRVSALARAVDLFSLGLRLPRLQKPAVCAGDGLV